MCLTVHVFYLQVCQGILPCKVSQQFTDVYGTCITFHYFCGRPRVFPRPPPARGRSRRRDSPRPRRAPAPRPGPSSSGGQSRSPAHHRATRNDETHAKGLDASQITFPWVARKVVEAKRHFWRRFVTACASIFQWCHTQMIETVNNRLECRHVRLHNGEPPF